MTRVVHHTGVFAAWGMLRLLRLTVTGVCADLWPSVYSGDVRHTRQPCSMWLVLVWVHHLLYSSHANGPRAVAGTLLVLSRVELWTMESFRPYLRGMNMSKGWL
jgi:hypothetical protein